jgi:ribonuclease E
MFSPQVVLKSGGYIVINQTEALVSIDVNSGKATREHNIEDTALKTNLEAAEEIARQLRLRDLAGLIVIDFIDMDERRNNRLVERRLKEALRNDRARIQVGRISHFGLLEMSRQRLRTGMLEGSTKPCPMCQGTGMVRSVESVALDILRSIEDRLITDGVMPLIATTAVDVALYILNQKRSHLNDIQQRYHVPIMITAADDMHISQFVLERAAEGEITNGGAAVVHMDWAHHHEQPSQASVAAPAPAQATESEGEQGHRRSRRRRRRGGGGDGRQAEGGAEHVRRPHVPAASQPEHESVAAEEVDGEAKEPQSSEARPEQQVRRGPRRRGRRGGRRGRSRDWQPGAERGTDAPRNDVRGEIQEREPTFAAAHSGETSSEGKDRPNGSDHPVHKHAEDSPAQEVAERSHRETERVFETVTSHERAAPARGSSGENEQQPEAPPRRGWWRR